MAYLADALVAIWSIGFCAGMYLNDFRRILNNHVPGAPFAGEVLSWKLPRRGRITKIDPASLNETGRAHLPKTIRNERIAIAWTFGGFFLTASVHYYMNP
ncbi:MAG: hypothetical protein PS018_20530 [bacterium]|nr:hypothetical protein [bacterium]